MQQKETATGCASSSALPILSLFLILSPTQVPGLGLSCILALLENYFRGRTLQLEHQFSKNNQAGGVHEVFLADRCCFAMGGGCWRCLCGNADRKARHEIRPCAGWTDLGGCAPGRASDKLWFYRRTGMGAAGQVRLPPSERHACERH